MGYTSVSAPVIGIIAVVLTGVAIFDMSTTRTLQDGDSADSAAESEPPASASEAVARRITTWNDFTTNCG